MSFSYLGGKKWKEISREERLFCAELYFQYRANPYKLVEILKKYWPMGASLERTDRGNDLMPNLDIDWEFAYEVCLYRDVLKAQDKGIKATEYSIKRTFDLCLFSNEQIIVIEAKANQHFDNKQLLAFDDDVKHIKTLFGLNQYFPVYLVCIKSSHYQPNPETRGHFDLILDWKNFDGELFQRADDIYKHKNKEFVLSGTNIDGQ